MKLRLLCRGILLVSLFAISGCDWFVTTAPPLPGAGSPTAETTANRASPSASFVGTPVSTSTYRAASPGAGSLRGDVNLSHLNFLVEDVEIADQPMAITHIYSEAPKYEWVDASGEGISALDDAARAAVVYLTDYERTQDPVSLDKARRLLNFAMYMQAEDGEFYNFITDRAGTINKTGNTSYKSSGWWAARGAWALGTGYRVLQKTDPAYAEKLRAAFTRTRDAWTREVAVNYGKYSPTHGVNVPGWLISGGADVSSIAALALLEYDAATGGLDAPTRDLLSKLCEGLSAYQHGDTRNYPFGLHPDSAAAPTAWHAWGSTSMSALARAGEQLGRPEWVESARREADTFYTRLLAGDMVSEWGVLPFAYPQIAYGMNSITQGLLALHRATGDAKYGRMAGLAVGWFYGNNSALFAMYDSTTGRGYDGLMGPSEFRVNRNAGAESTIEALMALQGIATDPLAQSYLLYKPQAGGSSGWQVIEAETARQTKGDIVASYKAAQSTGEARWSGEHYIQIGPNDAFTQDFNVAVRSPGSYYLYVAYLRQAAAQKEFVAEAVHASSPPTIDGDLGDWSATQPLSATAQSNILRGSAGWGGADKDAFVAYVMWDEQNLYVAARVFDPEHRQTEIGPSVWKGDTLWVYIDPNRDRSTVEAKLTLAQTPDGPQVWNWKANAYVRDAQMTWKGGRMQYVYEAKLPWASLGVSRIEVGKQMGIELGRGCCGSGFQDLSGKDPDTAGNLVQLTLVDALTPGVSSQVVSPGGPDTVALRWNLDGSGPRKQSQGGSPDRDYLWLERLTSTPVEMSTGPHTLTLEYAGTDPARTVTLDGFLLVPAQLTSLLESPQDGHSLTLFYDIDRGQFKMEEK